MKELREKYKKQSQDYDQEATEQGYRNWLINNNLETPRPISETERMEHNRNNDKIGSLGMRMLTPVATLGAIAGVAYLNRGGAVNDWRYMTQGARYGDRVVRDFFGNPVQGNDLNPEGALSLLSDMGYRGEAHRDKPHDLEVGLPTSYNALLEREEGELTHRHNPRDKFLYDTEENYYL